MNQGLRRPQTISSNTVKTSLQPNTKTHIINNRQVVIKSNRRRMPIHYWYLLHHPKKEMANFSREKKGAIHKSQASSGPIFEILGGGTSDHGSIPGNAWRGIRDVFVATRKNRSQTFTFPWSEKSSKTTVLGMFFFRNWSFEGIAIAININIQVRSVLR